ncbi:MAG: hypothetical protein GY851_26010 [bacterium]|nr:hypothetical protein [bacterium]
MKQSAFRTILCLSAIFAATGAYGEEAVNIDATLTAIALSHGEVSPGFSGKRTEYTVHVPYSASPLTVTPVPADPSATVTVQGAPLDNGASSVPLEPGRNLVVIDVTAADGITKMAYTVKAFRDFPTPNWQRVAETTPLAARDSAGELVFDGRMWIFGGYTPGLVNDVWSSRDGVEWTQTGSIPNESGVNIPVNFVHAGKMWVSCNDGRFYASEDGAAWTLVTEQAPWSKRYAAGGVVFNGRMWVMGGFKSGHLFNDVWSSADGVEWRLETEHADWSPRQLFGTVVAHDGKLWVVGGGITKYHPFHAYTDVWCSEDGRKWTCVNDHAPWPARIWSTVEVYRGRLWLIGGFRAEPTWNNFDDVWHSVDGVTWERLQTETVWMARHELSAYVYNDALWVVAGNAWPLMNDVWRLAVPGVTFTSQPVVEDFLGAEYTYRARAAFQAGAVRYRLVEVPDWLSVNTKTGVVRGRPEAEGDYTVVIEAVDSADGTARQAYTLHIIPLH